MKGWVNEWRWEWILKSQNRSDEGGFASPTVWQSHKDLQSKPTTCSSAVKAFRLSVSTTKDHHSVWALFFLLCSFFSLLYKSMVWIFPHRPSNTVKKTVLKLIIWKEHNATLFAHTVYKKCLWITLIEQHRVNYTVQYGRHKDYSLRTQRQK